MNLPFSQACENNKQPILNILKRYLHSQKCVLEIGSGTGQHAVYFAEQLPSITWQCSDREDNVEWIQKRIDLSGLANLPLVKILDVTSAQWPVDFDGVFSANTAHIMSWPVAKKMMVKVGSALPKDGLFFLYGPFNYGGQFTSESNEQFDQWLKEQDPERGIRDFEIINKTAEGAGLKLLEDAEMPANNRLLVWAKLADKKSF